MGDIPAHALIVDVGGVCRSSTASEEDMSLMGKNYGEYLEAHFN